MNRTRRKKMLGAKGIAGAVMREATDSDLLALRDIIQGSLRDLFKLTDDGDPWPWVIGLYVDRVIVELDGKLWSYPYTVEGTTVAFGPRAEVIREYVPVAPPSPQPAALIEALDSADGPPRFTVRIVRAGLSANGNFYPDAVLRESLSLFEGARVFVKSDAEHLHGAGKDFRNLIGGISDAVFVEGASPDTGEVRAVLSLIVGETDAIAVRLREAVSYGMTDLFGFSIDVMGTTREGAGGIRTATSFKKVKSVDLIVEPGAGGAIISTFTEAIAEGSVMNKEALIALITASNKALLEGKDLTTITLEELQAILSAALTPPAADPEPDQVTMTEAVGRQFRMRELIAGSSLPEASRTRLVDEISRMTHFTEAQIVSRIQGEARYLESVGIGANPVRGLGGTGVGTEEFQKIDDRFDAFFDPAHKLHRHARSFREAYQQATGDMRVTGRTDASVRFTEALTSASFASVLGNSITRRMIAEYSVRDQYDIWRLLTGTPVPISDFRTQERVRYGGYGDLPAVAEAAAYAALASPSDEKATYAVTKRGGLETITLEMIKNDDVGAIQRIPEKLARAAKRTLSKFVTDFIRLNPAMADTLTVFHATHGNLGSAALSATSYAAGRLAIYKQSEFGATDQLGINSKYLWIPADLEETATNLFVRNTNLDPTFVQSLSPTIVPVPFWTDANDWALTCDPKDIPFVEVGFLDGEEEPALFVQDSPTVGSFFSNDQLTYKIRHIYGGNVVDYRGAYKAVVA